MRVFVLSSPFIQLHVFFFLSLSLEDKQANKKIERMKKTRKKQKKHTYMYLHIHKQNHKNTKSEIIKSSKISARQKKYPNKIRLDKKKSIKFH